jgi:hypothetical protein
VRWTRSGPTTRRCGCGPGSRPGVSGSDQQAAPLGLGSTADYLAAGVYCLFGLVGAAGLVRAQGGCGPATPEGGGNPPGDTPAAIGAAKVAIGQGAFQQAWPEAC